MMRKGCGKPFAALSEKTADKVALECLKTRLELSEQSLIGKHLIQRFGEVMGEHDQAEGTIRVAPGHMVEEIDDKPVVLPMLPQEATERLAANGSLSEFYAHRELEQQVALREVDPDATADDLWSLTAKPVPGRLSSRQESTVETALERTERLSALPIPSPESLGVAVEPRKLGDAKNVPKEVVLTLQQEFAEGFSLRESMVEAVCDVVGGIYQWMHPRVSELQPGHVIWMARPIEYPRDWSGKVKGLSYVPVVLTHHRPDERRHPLLRPQDCFALEQKRVARMTVEAYTQGAVLSSLDLALLLGRSPSHVRKVLDTYQRTHQVLLPTTGTLLDMGSTLTHKKMAVELFLKGLTTSQISKRLFHTEQAIDNYLTIFNKVAMLYVLVTSDARFIAQITSISESLVREHLSLIHRYLPERGQLLQYLKDAGLELPPPVFG